MNKRLVLYEKREGVATVTLNRPDAKNAVNAEMASLLREIVKDLSWDDEIKVVLFAGTGGFCRGTDPEEISASGNRAALMERLSVASPVAGLDRPTIAAMEGDIFGQGLELGLACDFRVCTEPSRFAMDQVSYGDMPWDGGTQRLSRLVGRGKAVEMILTGETIDAKEAFRICLVNKVVPAGTLLETATALADQMASKAPVATRYAKEAVYKGMDLSLEQGLRLEADLYFLLHTTGDRTEGIRAFQEKRKPLFEGK